MQNNNDLKKFLLEEFGLSANETNLYIALLKNGHSTILELAEYTGINRATTHVNIESLTQKRLVTQIKKGQGSRRSIMAEPPEKLHALLKEQKAKIEVAEQQLPKIITELSNLKESAQKNSTSSMEIRYYKGKNEVRFIYDEALKAKEFRAYLNCKKLAHAFPANIEKFLEVHTKNKEMQMWEILEDSKESREYLKLMPKERYYGKLVPKNLNLYIPNIDYMMFDEKVAIIDLHEEPTGTMIYNKSLYASTVAIFNFVWHILCNYSEA